MAGLPPVGDDEIILRHIPAGTTWQGSPRKLKVTSSNFLLRHDRGEKGVSVTRWRITTPEELLSQVCSTEDSRVAFARAADIRALGFRVEPKEKKDDPGYAWIESGESSLDDDAARKRLRGLFQFLEPGLHSSLQPDQNEEGQPA